MNAHQPDGLGGFTCLPGGRTRGDDMAVFKDEAEVYQYIGGIFEEALADPVIGQKFADSGVILKVTHTEPDCVFTVDMPSKKVLYGDDARNGPKPVVEMKM